MGCDILLWPHHRLISLVDLYPGRTLALAGESGSGKSTTARGWLADGLPHYRVVLVDQRGTGGSTRVDGTVIAGFPDAAQASRYLLNFRADSIVRDLEHVRCTRYGGRRRAALSQSYGGWLTLAYLSHAPEALTACYVRGGIPGVPPDPQKVYRRTFTRAAGKTADFYDRYPQDVPAVAAIADRLAAVMWCCRTARRFPYAGSRRSAADSASARP